MKTSEQTNEILQALLEVKKELCAVSKSANNPFFKSKYADLNTHLDEVEPRLEKEGCILLQPVNVDNTVETRIVHVKSGQWISSEMQLINSKNTMQEIGSAITYARRYTLGALLSMKAEDDDGEKSMSRATKPAHPVTLLNNTPPVKTGLVSVNTTQLEPVKSTVETLIGSLKEHSTSLTPIKTSSFSKKNKQTPVTPLETTPISTTSFE